MFRVPLATYFYIALHGYETCLLANLLTSLDLRNGRVFVLKGDRRRGLVGLARGPVHRHDPEMTLILVIAGVQNTVALSNRVKEIPSAFQICKKTS